MQGLIHHTQNFAEAVTVLTLDIDLWFEGVGFSIYTFSIYVHKNSKAPKHFESQTYWDCCCVQRL